ncbi:MAG: zinc-ribbon domain-containing protein [Paracoccaceae bacterium]
MRLICPNCDAQYEVDSSVIPKAGRDVQCSNCGHTWLQPGADAPEGKVTAETAVARSADATEDDEAPPKASAPERRPLDAAVTDVLREEAARETRARMAEGSLVEFQEDLPLGGAAARPTSARAQAEDDPDDDGEDQEGAAVVSRSARRDLLPDIEEINSTLRATSDRGRDPASLDAPETLRQRRSGFRRGLAFGIILTGLLWLPYVFADVISARVPAVSGAVTAYATQVDNARTWLESVMRSTTQLINSDNG